MGYITVENVIHIQTLRISIASAQSSHPHSRIFGLFEFFVSRRTSDTFKTDFLKDYRIAQMFDMFDFGLNIKHVWGKRFLNKFITV